MKLETRIKTCKEDQQIFNDMNIDLDKLVVQIYDAVKLNFDLLNEAYKIDTNGNEINYDKLMSAINDLEEKTSEDGVIIADNDCNPYSILKLTIMAIQRKKGILFNVTENLGSSFMLIKLIQSVLKGLDLVQLVNFYNNDSEQ